MIFLFHWCTFYTFPLPRISSDQRITFSDTLSRFSLDLSIRADFKEFLSYLLCDGSIADSPSLELAIFPTKLDNTDRRG